MSEPGIDALMAIAMARAVRNGDFVSHGSAVPLAGAALMTARRLHAPDIEFFYDGWVNPADPDPRSGTLDPRRARETASAFLSQAQIMQLELRGRCDLQFLRPAQVDPYGGVNVSLIGSRGRPRRRFHGIAVADAMTIVRRICLYVTEHTARVLVRELDYVTAVGHGGEPGWRERLGVPGGGPSLLVTPLALLDFGGRGRHMRLAALMPGVDAEQVQSATGFELELADGLREIEPPSPAELAALDQADPLAMRQLEFRALRAAARQRLASNGRS